MSRNHDLTSFHKIFEEIIEKAQNRKPSEKDSSLVQESVNISIFQDTIINLLISEKIYSSFSEAIRFLIDRGLESEFPGFRNRILIQKMGLNLA
ncbi:MAG: hypothetical protein A2V66_10630 [Ignavibacteria bacterium RBG_13_36_8]|nr:MAG: hypothetical protein A2V66_10630 [Ignavibacteria bacterium RBG_13_36_8]